MVIKMNQENLNVIQEAINYLKSAKLDTDKNLINYAINYINLAINNYNKENNNVDEDIVKDEHFIYDEKSLPNIFINYYNPKIYYEDDVVIPFRFDDYHQRGYKYDE